jgi:polar amino acid transport system substrate-binding protein
MKKDKLKWSLRLMGVVAGVMGLAIAAWPEEASAQKIQQQIAGDSLLAEIKKRGVLNVGHGSFVPFAFRSVEGQYVGFEIDIFQKFADDMGVKFNNVPTSWDGIIPGLLAGKFDLISGMSPTPKRSLTVAFSNSYVPAFHQGFVTNRRLSTGLKTLEDFNNPKVTIVSRRGATAEDAAKKHLPKATHRLFDDDAIALQEVLNGNAHGIFSSEPKPTFWQKQFSDKLVKPFGNRPFSQGAGAGVAIRQGDFPMLTYINNWINWRVSGGFVQDRFDYWLGSIEWFKLDPKKQ